MKEKIHADSFLNEYKGNLFEFLVAQKFAQAFSIEGQLLSDLLPVYKDQLIKYELELKKIDLDLSRKLPVLAKKTFESLREEINFSPVKIFLVGKIANSSNHDLESTDILLLNAFNELKGISLKLSKDQSFINTKSGGVRSFLQEYFNHQEAPHLQEELNLKMSVLYQAFAHEIYSIFDLGEFDDFKRYRNEGLSELPGSLEGEARVCLLKYYNDSIKIFYENLIQLQSIDPKLFHQGLLRLIGFSDQNLVQVLVSHDNHEFKKIQIHSLSDFQGNSFEFREQAIGELTTSSLHLESNKLTLQIRLKPMNVFTTASMKVNCSIKHKS
jgi:hypothetical protein